MNTPAPHRTAADGPSYVRVFLTFARNSLVRDMTFRSNFIIESISSLSWVLMNLGFYVIIIYRNTDSLGRGTGWGKYEFLVFLATGYLINSIVQAFFMPNANEFSELIRTGNLDFALLKPIDTQFLVSLQRVEWSSLATATFAVGLLGYSLWRLVADGLVIGPLQVVLYPIYIGCGVAIMYSLMISMAATSVWLGRNQSLYNFWFYVTIFARHPMEIYQGPYGLWIRYFFTLVIPVLIAVNIPARMMAMPLSVQYWNLVVFALVATVICCLASRWLFVRSLASYRSASS